MAKVVVFGTGQWAEMAHFYLTHDSTHEVVAFTVDGDSMKANENRGLPVVPFEEVEKLYPPEQYEMFLPLGFKRMNHFRAEKYHQAKLKGYELVSYVSSKATTWPGLACGENCIISEGATIQPFAEIGDDVVIGPGSLVSHHSVIRDHVMLAPNAVVLGNCTVQPYCFIGANATVRDEVVLANDTLVGAGVTVVKNTAQFELYEAKAAEPARVRTDQFRRFVGRIRRSNFGVEQSEKSSQ
jgi:sugar O-acyltransferase (sialic acid O-acetyltransferase NeuD family)